MVLLYALGGGLGHLTRARCVIGALGLDGQVSILSASRYARDPRVTGGVPVIEVPRRLGRDRAGFRRWLAATLGEVAPDELIVDSFPGGILGELCGMRLPTLRHVSRRLRWEAYARRLTGPLPRFASAHVVEPLSARLAEVLAACSRRVEPLELPRGSAAPRGLIDGRHWLVVHSGPEAEVIELAEHAAELRAGSCPIAVVSPRRPSHLPVGCQWLDIYPVEPYLPHAERIVTAAGFNLMHETAPLRDRHTFIPFPRPLDDQFGRAAAAAAAIRAAVRSRCGHWSPAVLGSSALTSLRICLITGTACAYLITSRPVGARTCAHSRMRLRSSRASVASEL